MEALYNGYRKADAVKPLLSSRNRSAARWKLSLYSTYIKNSSRINSAWRYGFDSTCDTHILDFDLLKEVMRPPILF